MAGTGIHRDGVACDVMCGVTRCRTLEMPERNHSTLRAEIDHLSDENSKLSTSEGKLWCASKMWLIMLALALESFGG